ncbi:MAG: tetratricopeptide repeat protein [Kiritimatiellaeota bacterium]|nr:tetratricopeptide repeat protein [Kiritimatiellota bacterium]
MNEPRSGNIYGGGAAKRVDATPAGTATQRDIFVQDMLKRQRRQSALLIIMTTVVLLGLAGAIYYWQSLTKKTLYGHGTPEFSMETARTATTTFEEPLPLYLIDPLKQIKPVPIPNQPAELTVDWVKQAVYHLLEAEKAAQESRYDIALNEFNNVRKIYPGMKGLARMYGLIYLAQKNYPAAAQAFVQALQEEPPSFGVINNLGIAYIGMTNLPQAEACLVEAIKMDSNYALAYFNLAMIRQRQNDVPRAADYLGIYTRMRPGDSSAKENYALMLLNMGQWEKAALVLDELGDATPQSAVIQFRLAQAYSHVNGKREQALITLEHAVTLVDSRKALAWLARVDFDLLRSEPRFKKLSDQLSSKGTE